MMHDVKMKIEHVQFYSGPADSGSCTASRVRRLRPVPIEPLGPQQPGRGPICWRFLAPAVSLLVV